MLKNMKISAKMSLAMGIIMLALIATLAFSVFSLGTATLSLTEQRDDVVPALEELGIVLQSVELVPKEMYWALMSEDGATAAKSVETINEQIAVFTTAFNSLKSHEQLAVEELGQIDILVGDGIQYIEQLSALLLQDTDEARGQAYLLLINEVNPLFDEVSALTIQANAKIDDMIDIKLGEDAVVATNSTYALFAIGGVALIFTVFISISLIKGITKPLGQVSAAAIEMSKGNLNATIDYQSGDEIGMVANSLRASIDTINAYIQDIARATAMMANGDFTAQPSQEFIGDFKQIETSMMKLMSEMSSTLGQISIASEQVSAGSDQVSSGAQSLAQGATEQASSVEELSLSISEISEQVKLNAENSLKANKMAELATNAITSSNQQMQQLKLSMNEIDTKSKEINKIIKTIEDISFQTNILALNAAVEAAKAGTAGKGFAVVAEEVRNLAAKSAEAAKNTTDLIESSVSAIAQGVKYTDLTAEDLNSAVENVVATNDVISEISQASSEQAAAITQITIGLDQISAVVQTNSATSEESAAASEELSSQANLLKQLLSGFVLTDGNKQTVFAPTKSKLAITDSHDADSFIYNDDKY